MSAPDPCACGCGHQRRYPVGLTLDEADMLWSMLAGLRDERAQEVVRKVLHAVRNAGGEVSGASGDSHGLSRQKRDPVACHAATLDAPLTSSSGWTLERQREAHRAFYGSEAPF